MVSNYIERIKEIDKKSIIPIYYQLAKNIEQDIYEGKLKPGEVLPPEHEIASKLNISRMTVRRAISELVAVGIVYTLKGKGSFVAKPKLDNDNLVFELNNSYEDIKKMGMSPNSKLLGVKIVKADTTLAEKLQIPVNTSCLYFRLVLSADNEPLVYEKKYVVYTKQKPILEKELKDPSLSNIAAIHNEQMPTISKRILHATLVSKEEAKILGVPQNTPAFLVEQTIYDNDKKPMGWGKSIYRGDRYKFTSYTGWPTNES